MAFLIDLPTLTLKKEFTIPEVRTKSSVAKQGIRDEYRDIIRQASSNFQPLSTVQYIISSRISISSKRRNFPDAENIVKEIIDVLFPDDSIKIIKGIITETEITNIETNEEKSQVFIYSVD